MLGLLRRSAQDTSGSAMIEAAFVLPVVLLMVLGAIEFGRYYWIRNTFELAVEEAARYATLNKNATDVDIQTKVRSVVGNIVKSFDATTISVSVVPTPGGNVTYKTIRATLSTNDGKLRFMTGILPIPMLRLEAQTRAVVPN